MGLILYSTGNPVGLVVRTGSPSRQKEKKKVAEQGIKTLIFSVDGGQGPHRHHQKMSTEAVLQRDVVTNLEGLFSEID